MGQVALIVSALLAAALIARSAEVSEVGEYAVAAAIATLVSVTTGMQLTQQVCRSESLEEAVGYLPWSLVAAASGVLVALLILLFASFFGGFEIGPLAWLLPAIACQPLIDALMGLFVRQGRAGALTAQHFVRATSRPLIVLLLLAFVVGPVDAQWIAVVDTTVAVVVLGSLLFAHGVASLRRQLALRLHMSLGMVLPGVGALLIMAASWQVIQRTDLLAIQFFLGSADAGRYSVALRLFEAMLAFYAALMAFCLPLLTRARQHGTVSAEYIRATVLGVQFVLPVLIGVAVWGDRIVASLFGDLYSVDVVVYALLAVGVLAHVVTGPNGFLLVASRRHGRIALIGGAVAVLNLLLNLLLVPWLGLLGGAMASLLSLATLNASYTLAVRTQLGGFRSLARVGLWEAAYALALLASLAVPRLLLNADYWAAMCGCAFGAVVFAGSARSAVAAPVMRSLVASLQPARS